MIKTDRPRSLLAEFWYGATRPSATALLGAIAVLITLASLAVYGIDERLLGQRGFGYFANAPEDEYAHLTMSALRLYYEPPPHSAVLLIGNSSFREALSSARQLEAQLVERTGQDIAVCDLTAGALSLWEMVSLVDRLAGRVNGLAILEISPNQFSRDESNLAQYVQRPRLAMHSPFLEMTANEHGVAFRVRSGNYFLDNYRYFVARPAILWNLVRGPVSPRVHFAEIWGRPTRAEWEGGIRNMGRWRNGYLEHRGFTYPIMERLIERARLAGLQVVLVETVTNPTALDQVLASPEDRAVYATYLDDMRRLAADRNVPYWNLQESVTLEPGHFLDHCHLRDAGSRDAFTAVLRDRLLDLLTNGGKPEAGPR